VTALRLARPSDGSALFALHGAAFPTPAEARLVADLEAGGHTLLSVVALLDEVIAGHVLFSRMHIGSTAASALAPVAVLPARQRHGVGSAMIEEGLRLCRAQGEKIVCVLGAPAYYRRFGFAEASTAIERPWPGPHFMAMALIPGALDGIGGIVRYPAPFGID